MDGPARHNSEPQFDKAGPFSDGVACVGVKNKVGYMDRNQKFITELIFDEGKPFHDGWAAVRKDAKWGFIDKSGKFLVEPRYQNVGHMAPAFAAVLVNDGLNNRWAFVDRTGKTLSETVSQVFWPRQDGMLTITNGTKHGLVDATGRVVIKPEEYDWIGSMDKDGRVAVGLGARHGESQVGLVDSKTGKVIAKPRYGASAELPSDDAWPIAPKPEAGKWGFVDKDGKFIIDPVYDKIAAVDAGLVAVRDAKLKWGLVDVKAGKLLFAPKYYEIGKFSDGLAPFRAQVMGKMGYINTAGKVIIAAKFHEAMPFRDGIGPVTFYSSNTGIDQLYVNKTGKYLWGPTE